MLPRALLVDRVWVSLPATARVIFLDMVLERSQKSFDFGVLRLSSGAKEGGKRCSRQPGLIEYELLLCRTAEAVKLVDKFAHRAVTTVVLIPADMGADVAFDPRKIVPMGGSRIARPPLFPSEIRWLSIDPLDTVPFDPDPEVRVDPAEVVGNL
jgi:hypothetical protein